MKEMKLMMQQMELANLMTAASVQLGQLATSRELLQMSSELTELLNKMAAQVAKEQAIIELSK